MRDLIYFQGNKHIEAEMLPKEFSITSCHIYDRHLNRWYLMAGPYVESLEPEKVPIEYRTKALLLT